MFRDAKVCRRSWKRNSLNACEVKDRAEAMLQPLSRAGIVPPRGKQQILPDEGQILAKLSGQLGSQRNVTNPSSLQLWANRNEPFGVVKVAPYQAKDFCHPHTGGERNDDDHPRPVERSVQIPRACPMDLSVERLSILISSADRYPIESAMESNRLVPSAGTCQQCHWPQNFNSTKLRVIFHFQDDAANTQTQTVLMMLTGGGDLGGIHGKHLAQGVEISYAASDKQRQTIPRVEYRNRNTGEVRTFLADGSTAKSTGSLPRYRAMD